MMSAKLGISQEGYPNVVVYAAGNELIGRIIGFGGTDSWFGQLKDAMGIGDKLIAAKGKTEEKPEAWIDVADLLVTIPGRAEDALAALENVPKRHHKSKTFQAAKARIGAHAGWSSVSEELDGLLRGVRSRDAAAEKAPGALEKLDAFIEEHGGASTSIDPTALAKKGFFLMLLDRTDEALEIAKRLLTEFPESDAAQGLLRGLR